MTWYSQTEIVLSPWDVSQITVLEPWTYSSKSIGRPANNLLTNHAWENPWLSHMVAPLQCLSRCHTLMKQKFNSGLSVGESQVNLALLCVFYVQQLRSKYFNCHLSIKRKVFIYTRRLTSYVGIHWDTHIALNTSAIPPIPAAHLLCKTTCRRAEVKIYDFDSNHRWRTQKAIREWSSWHWW